MGPVETAESGSTLASRRISAGLGPSSYDVCSARAGPSRVACVGTGPAVVRAHTLTAPGKFRELFLRIYGSRVHGQPVKIVLIESNRTESAAITAARRRRSRRRRSATESCDSLALIRSAKSEGGGVGWRSSSGVGRSRTAGSGCGRPGRLRWPRSCSVRRSACTRPMDCFQCFCWGQSTGGSRPK